MYRLIEQRVFYTDSHQAYRKSLRDAQKSMNTLPPSLATDEGVDSLEMYERHHSKELLQECWDWAESLLDTLKECNRAGRELERRRKELVKSGILKERPFIGLDEKISNPFVFETILRYDRDSNGVGAPPTSSIQSSKPEDGPSAVESTRRHTASF
ncbi:hypothetical protein TREMEDRAFT_61034 [Tremella mesenterica DSM 1558]|nr:uncharacterized protein TREMEDRAFT_61034 [Tremella mesenterica DSM 1558]EIW70529.1 hypothetical protein TREMEDRAFT_61034 [Tremella mesenterica DSM 1558]